MSMATGWLSGLSPELAAQRRLLERLVGWCEQDDDVRWLVVGCSFARGTADRFSDLDLAMGLRDEAFAEALDRVRQAVAGLDGVVERFDHELGLCFSHRRLFAQYTDRTQLDLVVSEASHSTLPGVVVLYDPEGLVRVAPAEVAVPSAEEVRTWACLAWAALADLVKYLNRSSFWEAVQRLEEARGHLFRLWAAAEHVPDARYGITAIADAPGASLPPGIERSLSGASLSELAVAARHLADALVEVGLRLGASGPYVLPDPLAGLVGAELAALADDDAGSAGRRR